MDAIHIKTSGFYCKACPKVVEKALGTVEGVVHVVSVHSMNMTSVMFDPEQVSRDELCGRIRQAGFGAEPLCSRADAE